MKKNFPQGRKASAFTLIELLVVFAIIAILAALLLPALAKYSPIERNDYLALNVPAGDSWIDISWLADNTTVRR